MLADVFFFVRRLMDHQQRVNKKQNVEIDRTASSGGQGNYVRFPWLPLEAAL
jgi:hypothetical protein